MSKRKSFLLRMDPKLHAALERWAADELRSVNGQIEFLLRQAVIRAGRLKANPPVPDSPDAPDPDPPSE